MSESKTASNSLSTMIICFLVTVLEGYDLQIISSAGPILQGQMGLSPDQTGFFFSATLIGLAIGAIIGGRIADRIGRKPALVWSVAALGVFTLATALATSFEMIVALRILAGIGLGGAMPTLIALVAEFTGGKNTTAAVTTIIVGQPLGGIISAMTGRTLTGAYGWEALFLVGGLLTVIMIPLMLKFLPETNPATPGSGAARMPVMQTLFGEGRAVPTVLLWVIFILTLALLSVCLSWTPVLVMGKGFDFAIGLNAIMAINAGGIVGGVVMSRMIDRMGVRWPMIALYVLMTVGLYFFARAADFGPLMATAFVVGFGVLGAQFTLYGVSPQLYPKSGRGAGVGWAVAMGRIGSIMGPVVVGGMLTGGSTPTEVLAVMAPVALAAGAALFVMTMTARLVSDNAAPAGAS